MKEFFGEKYREAITQKQQSISDYQLAIQKLMEAFQKRNHQQDEFPETITHTINELRSLQQKKRTIGKEESFMTQTTSTPNAPNPSIDIKPNDKPKQLKPETIHTPKIQKEEKKPELKIRIQNDAPIPSPWSSPLIISKKQKKKRMP
ncbi:MAG: hypothetical protein Q8934_11185 [Bacillota bacterium]|nr:hypothetical protein [Bacillota bacterium]